MSSIPLHSIVYSNLNSIHIISAFHHFTGIKYNIPEIFTVTFIMVNPFHLERPSVND